MCLRISICHCAVIGGASVDVGVVMMLGIAMVVVVASVSVMMNVGGW